jgi:hypothetical protein
MRQVIKIIPPAIMLIVILALMLTSGAGCGGSEPDPTSYAKVYYQIGQAAQQSREVLTIVSTDRVDRIKYPLGIGSLWKSVEVAIPGTVLLVVDVAVTNVGQSGSLSISYKDFSMTDSQGRVWPCLKYPGYHPYPSKKKLASGQSAAGYIYFNPLATATGLELSCVLQGSPPVLAVWQIP